MRLPVQRPTRQRLPLTPNTREYQQAPTSASSLLRQRQLRANRNASVRLRRTQLKRLARRRSHVRPHTGQRGLQLQQIHRHARRNQTRNRPLYRQPTKPQGPKRMRTCPLLFRWPQLQRIRTRFHPHSLQLQLFLRQDRRALRNEQDSKRLRLPKFTRKSTRQVRHANEATQGTPLIRLQRLSRPRRLLRQDEKPQYDPRAT